LGTQMDTNQEKTLQNASEKKVGRGKAKAAASRQSQDRKPKKKKKIQRKHVVFERAWREQTKSEHGKQSDTKTRARGN